MKKILVTIVIIFLILFSAFYIYQIKNKRNNSTNNYSSEKTSTESNDKNVKSENTANFSEQNSKSVSQHSPVESEELSVFSTKIYTKDKNRQNNVSITCSTLNNTDVSKGQTFSFCNTVGRASPNKGYTKADIFTNGKKVKGYGGGNCQISTTLYNAVLKVPNLNVTERHEHSNKVPYIKSGKDAAVSYGTYDFKFVNNTENTVRIKANNTSDSITIKIVKLV